MEKLGGHLFANQIVKERTSWDFLFAFINDHRIDILQRTMISDWLVMKVCKPYAEMPDDPFLASKFVAWDLLLARWLKDYEAYNRHLLRQYQALIDGVVVTDEKEMRRHRRSLVTFGEIQVIAFAKIIWGYSFKSKHSSPEMSVFMFNPNANSSYGGISPDMKEILENANQKD